MKAKDRSILVRILVLDDKTTAALGSFDKGLAVYAVSNKLAPQKIPGGVAYELPPAAGVLPAIRLEVITNKTDCVTPDRVIQAIDDGEFQGRFDGILLDDNWGGNKFQGHQDILPVLTKCQRLDPTGRLQIAIFSMHFVRTFEKHSRDAKVLGAFEHSLSPEWKGRVDILGKSDAQDIARWFAKIVRNRPPEMASILIDTTRGCEIRIGAKPLHSMFKRHCVLGYLKLAFEGKAAAAPFDLAQRIENGVKNGADPVWQEVKRLTCEARPGSAATFQNTDVSKAIDFLKNEIVLHLSAFRREELLLLGKGEGGKTRNAREFVNYFRVRILPER